jgi:hypothetical protein
MVMGNFGRFLRRRRGRSPCRKRRNGTRLLRWGFLPAQSLEMFPHFVGNVVFKGTRMRRLAGESNLRQILDDRLALDLEFARQIVNANLTHRCCLVSQFRGLPVAGGT